MLELKVGEYQELLYRKQRGLILRMKPVSRIGKQFFKDVMGRNC
jgi:hypothetical protein